MKFSRLAAIAMNVNGGSDENSLEPRGGISRWPSEVLPSPRSGPRKRKDPASQKLTGSFVLPGFSSEGKKLWLTNLD
jgi:hypothetical protein